MHHIWVETLLRQIPAPLDFQANDQFIISLLCFTASQPEQLENMCLSSTCGQPLRSKAVYTSTLLQTQKADPRNTHSSRNREKTNTHGTAQRRSTSQQHCKLSTLGDKCWAFTIRHGKIGSRERIGKRNMNFLTTGLSFDLRMTGFLSEASKVEVQYEQTGKLQVLRDEQTLFTLVF